MRSSWLASLTKRRSRFQGVLRGVESGVQRVAKSGDLVVSVRPYI